MIDSDKGFYLKVMMCEECPHCDRWKRRGASFCYRDYKRLPVELQRALWRRIGRGYEKAFEAAFAWLAEDERGGL